jgi:hypothetical protein
VVGTQEHTGGGPRVQCFVWPSGQNDEPDDPAFRAKAALGAANIESERNVRPKSVMRVKDILLPFPYLKAAGTILKCPD